MQCAIRRSLRLGAAVRGRLAPLLHHRREDLGVVEDVVVHLCDARGPLVAEGEVPPGVDADPVLHPAIIGYAAWRGKESNMRLRDSNESGDRAKERGEPGHGLVAGARVASVCVNESVYRSHGSLMRTRAGGTQIVFFSLTSGECRWSRAGGP